MTTDDISYSRFTGWIDEPMDIAPALVDDIRCDVAVVGGGLGGMATALRLAERGVDVVLLESRFCGRGASSRNAGQLTGAPAGDPQLLSALYPRRFRNLVRFAEGAVPFVEDLMARFSIDCDYEPTGNVGAAVSESQLRKARRVANILQRAGASATFGNRQELGLPHHFLGGTLERLGGTLDPGKLTFGVRDALLRSPARVFEGTPVRAVEHNGARLRVQTPMACVQAERVVLCTNAYAPELAITPKNLASPVWVSMVETEPIEPERLEATGWTSRCGIATEHNLMEAYRISPRNTIVFGVRQLQVGHGVLKDRVSDSAVVADLTRAFRTRFRSLAQIRLERTWGGWIAMTSSWLPVAGSAEHQVYYSIACNGHGLGQAPYLGSLLADHLAGDDPHDDLLAVWVKEPRFLPTPVFTGPGVRAVWAMDRMADLLSRR